MRLFFNGSKVSAGVFAGAPISDSELLDRLAEAMLDGEPFDIDEESVIQVAGLDSREGFFLLLAQMREAMLDGEPFYIDEDAFIGGPMDRELLAQARKAMLDEGPFYIDEDVFADELLLDSELLDQLAEAMLDEDPFYIDEKGVIQADRVADLDSPSPEDLSLLTEADFTGLPRR